MKFLWMIFGLEISIHHIKRLRQGLWKNAPNRDSHSSLTDIKPFFDLATHRPQKLTFLPPEVIHDSIAPKAYLTALYLKTAVACYMMNSTYAPSFIRTLENKVEVALVTM
jgi:hypothetical protein